MPRTHAKVITIVSTSICNPHAPTVRWGQRQENLHKFVCQLAWHIQVVTRKRPYLKQDEGKDWPEAVLTFTYMQCHTRTPALTHEHEHTNLDRQFIDWELKLQYYQKRNRQVIWCVPTLKALRKMRWECKSSRAD